MVHVSNETVQCQDIHRGCGKCERKMISDDMSNEPAIIEDIKVEYHQLSTSLEENAEPKDIASENMSYVSSGENWNNNEAHDDTRGFEEKDVCTPKKCRVAEPSIVSEMCVSDVATLRRAKRVIALVKRDEPKKRKRINLLHRQKRDLLKRITSLQDMVKHLRQQRLVSESAGESVMVMYQT